MKRLLIYRSGALGDFLLTLPALEGIHQQWPEAERTLITRPSYGELMLAFQLVEKTCDLNSQAISSLFSPAGNLTEHTRAWLTEFDVVIAWVNDDDGNLERNIRANTDAELFILNPVLTENGIHATRQLSNGMPFPCPENFVFPTHNASIQHVRPRIALHAGSGSQRKNLPPAVWSEVLLKLAAANPELEFLLITGEADEMASSEIRKLPLRWLPEARNLSLPALAAQLQRCHAYLGHDTGVSHFAAALSIPSLLWFGPTDPKIWAPASAAIHRSQNADEMIATFCHWWFNLKDR